MTPELRRLTAPLAVLAALVAIGPADAQKPGGVARRWSQDFRRIALVRFAARRADGSLTVNGIGRQKNLRWARRGAAPPPRRTREC
jgi:hypothetical protein